METGFTCVLRDLGFGVCFHLLRRRRHLTQSQHTSGCAWGLRSAVRGRRFQSFLLFFYSFHASTCSFQTYETELPSERMDVFFG